VPRPESGALWADILALPRNPRAASRTRPGSKDHRGARMERLRSQRKCLRATALAELPIQTSLQREAAARRWACLAHDLELAAAPAHGSFPGPPLRYGGFQDRLAGPGPPGRQPCRLRNLPGLVVGSW